MKILSCSDVHLDTFNSFAIKVDNPVSNSRLENTLSALDTFFEYGNNNGVNTYVINGDLFNQRLNVNPSLISYCIKRIWNGFSNTSDGSILLLNIGNHDEATRYIKPNSLELFTELSTSNHQIKVVDIEASLYSLYDSELLLIPYTEDIEISKKEINTQLRKLTKPTVVFAHLGVDGSVSGRWSHRLGGAYNLSDLGWNNDNVKDIVLGHYHLRQTLKKQDYKEAWYQGDLIPINFNDVEENGLGSKRGFDLIDSVTGEHKFIELTDKLPTFNIIDLATTDMSSDDILKLAQKDYVRLIIHNEKDYKKMKELLADSLSNIEIQLKKDIEEIHELDIDETSSDKEIMKKYFDKYYPDKKRLFKKALSFLEEE